MFDIGWSELAVIAVVALIVIGPRDLPRVLYTAGKMAGKARAMLRELQQGIEDIGREAELEEMRKKIETVRDFDVNKQIRNTVDPQGDMERAFDNEPGLRPAPPPDLPPPEIPAPHHPPDEYQAERQTDERTSSMPEPAEAPQPDDPPPVRG